jgi:sarcosine oxidase subunit gamma
VAIRFQAEEAERAAAESLGICDLSALAKLGVKGPEAATWLARQGLDVPADVLDVGRLPGGGVIARIAADEFLLEDGPNGHISSMAARLASDPTGPFAVVRQEATFLLSGRRSLEVLAQTCAIDFRAAVLSRLVFTRVAGVTCAVTPELVGEVPAFRLWVDGTYAEYLWEVLVSIGEERGGCVIGAGWLMPEAR